MKTSLSFFGMASLAALLIACGGDDDSDSVGPRIGGTNWKGDYHHTDKTRSRSITATITVDGSAVTIKTSKTSPPGQTLTGTINSEGHMRLTDSSDGELWTTFFGPATSNHVEIADFLYPPTAGATNKPPLQVIEVRR